MKRTVGWFVRKGAERGRGEWLFFAQYHPSNGFDLVWDDCFRLLFNRKCDAARAIDHLGPKGARLIRLVRNR